MHRSSKLFLIAAGLSLLAGAQLGAQAVSYGGIGDPAAATGDPRTSYALSGLDHVNYYNGLVNLTLPVHSINGRGTLADNIVIPIQRQWTVENVSGSYVPGTGGWPIVSGQYTSGYISLLTVSGNADQCVTYQDGVPVGYSQLGPFLSYIVWHAIDGTQTILRDLKSNGQPQNGDVQTCGQSFTPYDRGTVFQSADGSDLTFVANSNVFDGNGFPGGTLITRDGTKYSFSADTYVSQIEDRNGNQIQFSFSSTFTGGIYTVNDPAGRTQSINFTEDLNHNTQDVISYPGTNGATRTVTVNYALLQDALAPNESLQTYQCLFPELQGSSTTQFNGFVVSSVVLADGTSYTVKYNAYGEPAELTLPTGAKYVYKYAVAACAANGNSGVVSLGSNGGYAIYRGLIERDEYANGGTALTAKILFSRSTGYIDGNFPTRPTSSATVTFQDANSTTLRTEQHYFWGNPTPTNPPASNATQFASWWLGLEYATAVTDPAQGTVQFTSRAYGQRPCPGAGEQACPNGNNLTVDTVPSHDPQVCQVSTLSGGTTPSLVSTAYVYDQYNNATDVYNFDFGYGSSQNGACPTAFSGALRHIQTAYLSSNSSGTYTAPQINILSLPSEVKILDGSGATYSDTKLGYDENKVANAPNIVGHDNANYAGDRVRGNLTSISSYLNTAQTWLTTQIAYDIAGNPVNARDPKGNITFWAYDDAYPGGTRNSYAHATSLTDAMGEHQTWTFDYGSGKPLTMTNINGGVTSYGYNDPLDRLTSVFSPDGSLASYAYPSVTEVDAYQDQNTAGDQVLRSQTLHDGLGRTVESRTYESANNYISTKQTYDALSRVAKTTNPSRSGDGLDYATTYSYDALGRTLSVTTPDGNLASNSYSGNTVTVQDQQGKSKAYTYDALGQLAVAKEDPSGLNFLTSYQYDPLGNLKGVTQGSQTRSFSYDSLSRQVSAMNPESGTVGYAYDRAGNLTTKTDARGVTATTSYDLLNRPVATAYSDGTPTAHYDYGTPSNGIANSLGQLTAVRNNVSATYYTAFDAMGRVLASNQQTLGQTYNFAYSHNLAGSLTSETYPTGRIIATSYDGMNRPQQLSGIVGAATTNYVSGASYLPHGALNNYTRGNGLYSASAYNSRLQPAEAYEMQGNDPTKYLALSCWNWGTQRSSSVCPGFTTANNNGTLLGRVEYAGGPGAPSSLASYPQSYSYDNVNRLTAASDSYWSRSFGYDQWGNLSVTGNTNAVLNGLTPQSNGGNPYDANNRLVSTVFSYDAAGNTTALGSIAIQYDAENRQKQTSDSVAHTQANYGYDGAAQRVTKIVASGPTSVYVYDAQGVLAAEYSTAANTAPCSPCYLSYDHLGSVRMVTDQSGNVVSRHEYMPYGEEIPGSSLGRSSEFGASDSVRQRFSGQERDAENSPALDFFNARHMSSTLGRFMSADPGSAGADITNPQSWNAYAYVLSNPLAMIDPSGMDGEDPCFGDPYCGWDLFPPIILSLPSAPPPITVQEPLPPGSFPRGETLGLPPGVQIPGPLSPEVLLGLEGWDCGFGPCVPGLGTLSVDPNQIENHHVFVRALEDWFEAREIKINDYLLPLSAALHRLKPNGLHTINGGNWNAEWNEFAKKFPNATRKQTFDFARGLFRKFNLGEFPWSDLDVPFVVCFTCRVPGAVPVSQNPGTVY